MAKDNVAPESLVPLPTIFGGNTGLTYEDLQRRRAIVQALASRQKGFPKNVGEGLTYLGESIGEGLADLRLAGLERQQKGLDAGGYSRLTPTTTTDTTTTDTPPTTTTDTTTTDTPAPPEAPVAAPPAPGASVFPDPPPAPVAIAPPPPNVMPGARPVQTTSFVRPPEPEPQVAEADPYLPPASPPSPLNERAAALAMPQGAPEPPPPAVPPPEPAPAPQAAAPPQAIPFEGPMPDPRWAAKLRALAGIETGGKQFPYQALGAVTKTGDQAHGKYQIMGENIPAWSREKLGYPLTKEEFLQHPNAQDIITRQKMGEYERKYGEEGSGRAWYGGETGMKNLAATDVHGRLSVGGYGRDYVKRIAANMGATGDGSPGPQGPVVASRGGGVARPPEADPLATPDVRDAVAMALMQQPQQPPQAQEEPPPVQSDDRLAEMLGNRRPGSPFRATASRGDIQSDAPGVGLSPLGQNTGDAIAASVDARRNAIAGALTPQPAPAPDVPPPDTGAPVRVAQAMQPGIRPDAAGGWWQPPAPARQPDQGIRPAPASPSAMPPAPEPVPFPAVRPEPKPPRITPSMQEALAVSRDQRLSPAVRQEALRVYGEEKGRQDAQFTRDYNAWRDDVTKKREYELADPQRRQQLTQGHLANEKAVRDLEGEGFVPLTEAERASLLPPGQSLPAGQTMWKNRRGEIKAGPIPPASTTVTVDQRGENEFAKENARGLAKMFGGMTEAGMGAADDLEAISSLRKSGVQTGGWAAMTKHLADYGIKLPGASQVEFYTSMIDRLTPQQRVPGSGTTSDFDARSFKSSLPGLMRTPEGNNMIMDVMESIAENKMKRADVALRVQTNELSPADGVRELRALQLEAKQKSDAVKAYLSEQEKAAGGGAKPAPAAAPTQDDAARDWLKNNPNDPRAPAVRQRLGM